MVKTTLISLIMTLGLLVVHTQTFANTPSCSTAQETQQTQKNVDTIKLSNTQGPLCSDGSRCSAIYSYCCNINDTPTCVKKLEDCVNK